MRLPIFNQININVFYSGWFRGSVQNQTPHASSQTHAGLLRQAGYLLVVLDIFVMFKMAILDILIDANLFNPFK